MSLQWMVEHAQAWVNRAQRPVPDLSGPWLWHRDGADRRPFASLLERKWLPDDYMSGTKGCSLIAHFFIIRCTPVERYGTVNPRISGRARISGRVGPYITISSAVDPGQRLHLKTSARKNVEEGTVG
ncbi:hypothetical protein [Sphingobium sp. BS19]|uniref:hypothetical protein n=1 Tax=Sphingobium sp. BS19 TaxID=3018973 RepID=UPI002493C0D3|nr:hypothetical protein [Sphingobium sp. BS19]